MTRGIGEQELLRRMAGLPREIRPERDPWPDIASRIQAPPARTAGLPRWSLAAAAASLVVAFAAGWLLAPQRTVDQDTANTVAQVAAAAAISPAASSLPATVAASEAEYLAAFREFIPVGSARQNLSPRTIALIETGWADLRETERRLVAALESNPDDAFLNDRMLELRARQLAFLQRLATLDLDNRRLTI